MDAIPVSLGGNRVCSYRRMVITQNKHEKNIYEKAESKNDSVPPNNTGKVISFGHLDAAVSRYACLTHDDTDHDSSFEDGQYLP